jgi:hypothetical protein
MENAGETKCLCSTEEKNLDATEDSQYVWFCFEREALIF